MELSIDTSTRFASIAISSNGEIQSQLSWRSKRNHSIELMPAIRELFGNNSTSVTELDAVFVTRGPGSFSAIRVGMSTAKAIASGANIPIVGVSTLLLEAYPFIGLREKVIGLVPAGRGRVYAGTFRSDGSQDSDYRLLRLQEEPLQADSDSLFCGESVVDLVSEGYLEETSLTLNVPAPTRLPSVLASIGYVKLHEGKYENVETLEPIYVYSAQIDSAERNRLSKRPN